MEQLELFKPKKPAPMKKQPQEWMLVSVRECPTPEKIRPLRYPAASRRLLTPARRSDLTRMALK